VVAVLVRQSMLTPVGLVHAFLLGSTLWASFGPMGWSLQFLFLVVSSGLTRVGWKVKEERGIAEKRGGRRGVENLYGAAGASLVLALVYAGTGWRRAVDGFVAAVATKMGDTAGSEIGKAFGKDTFLLTSGKKVPAGTEGAVSREGTLAVLLGAAAVAVLAWAGRMVGPQGAVVVTMAAFLANMVEGLIGSTMQEKMSWTNEFVNFLNTSIGAILTILVTTLLRL